MQHQKPDYPRFKQDINLTQYAAHMGYEIDRKKSTRSSIAMRNGADKVIISRRGGNWVYFSVSDDSDNGTIINFIENRTRKTIGEIGQELNTWLGGAIQLPQPQNYAPLVAEQKSDPARIRQIFQKCRVVTKHAYLESRGITEALLSSERFTGRVFKDRYNNAVFPHYSGKGVCALELKNAEKCIFVRGSEKTLWRSNTKADDNTLVIAEAVIDVLSYHQLFNLENALYVATGGGMSPEQGRIIRLAAQNLPALKTITLITDNDEGGDKLTAKLKAIIAESGFKGEVIRHSPQGRGDDWNDVLNSTTNQ